MKFLFQIELDLLATLKIPKKATSIILIREPIGNDRRCCCLVLNID